MCKQKKMQKLFVFTTKQVLFFEKERDRFQKTDIKFFDTENAQQQKKCVEQMRRRNDECFFVVVVIVRYYLLDIIT